MINIISANHQHGSVLSAKYGVRASSTAIDSTVNYLREQTMIVAGKREYVFVIWGEMTLQVGHSLIRPTFTHVSEAVSQIKNIK